MIFCRHKLSNSEEEESYFVLAFSDFTFLIVETIDIAEIIHAEVVEYLTQNTPMSSIKREFCKFSKTKKFQCFCGHSEVICGIEMENLIDFLGEIIQRHRFNCSNNTDTKTRLLFVHSEFGAKQKVAGLIGNILTAKSVAFHAKNSIPIQFSGHFDEVIKDVAIFLTMTTSCHLDQEKCLFINHNYNGLRDEILSCNFATFPNMGMKKVGNFTDYHLRYNIFSLYNSLFE